MSRNKKKKNRQREKVKGGVDGVLYPSEEVITKEVWRDVVGYEGWYQVSDFGRMKSIRRRVSQGDHFVTVQERILKTPVDTYGYPSVSLRKSGVAKGKKVHRLVLEVFVGLPPFSKAQCCHGDGIRTNNRIENLRWGSQKENSADMVRHGNAREQPVQRGDGIVFPSLSEAARQTGCRQGNITRCLQDLDPTAGGYSWSCV